MSKQIDVAVRILSPAPKERRNCEKLVLQAIGAIDSAAGVARDVEFVRSAPTKKLLRQALYALRKLPTDPIFHEAMTRCEELLAEPRAANRLAVRQHEAIKFAKVLLAMYGHDLTTTRGGNFDRLAVALSGTRVKTLSRHLTAARERGTYTTMLIARRHPEGRKPKSPRK